MLFTETGTRRSLPFFLAFDLYVLGAALGWWPGGALIEPSVARKMVAEFARLAPSPGSGVKDLAEPLSERELDILRLLSQGMTNKEIAARAHLAEGTVKNYVSGILAKIGVNDRAQAVLKAKELGLL